MPSGRVRWFDAKKGFGFITNDEGEDVFLPAAALPDGVTTLRPKPDDMAAIVEDLIKLLDSAGNELRRHRYPSAADSRKLATLLRGVADSFDVQE